MFHWSDKQQPVTIALEIPELISCYMHQAHVHPGKVSLLGSVGTRARQRSSKIPVVLRMRKSGVFGMLRSLLSFRILHKLSLLGAREPWNSSVSPALPSDVHSWTHRLRPDRLYRCFCPWWSSHGIGISKMLGSP